MLQYLFSPCWSNTGPADTEEQRFHWLSVRRDRGREGMGAGAPGSCRQEQRKTDAHAQRTSSFIQSETTAHGTSSLAHPRLGVLHLVSLCGNNCIDIPRGVSIVTLNPVRLTMKTRYPLQLCSEASRNII